MKRLFLSVLLTALVAASQCAHAWGAKGHALIGALADRNIAGTSADTEAKKLLGMDLATASVWADCAKGVNMVGGELIYFSNPKYVECRALESDSEKAAMIDYVRRNWDACKPAHGEETCHKQYHYTDVPIERSQYRQNSIGTSDHDVVHALTVAIHVLQGKPSESPFNIRDKREALLLLVHLVGDIHQPLHVGAIYLGDDGQALDPEASGGKVIHSTRGGNDIDAHGPNLHASWDEIPKNLDAASLSDDLILLARSEPIEHGNPDTWPVIWANQSLAQATLAYAGIEFVHQNAHSHEWTATYPNKYALMRKSMQRQQIALAANHLTALLNVLLRNL